MPPWWEVPDWSLYSLLTSSDIVPFAMVTNTSQEVELFSDNEVTARVLDVIKSANQKIALICPYIDRVGHVEQELVKAAKRGVKILVVLRNDRGAIGGNKSKLALDWFSEQKIQVESVPNLHAKFYMNEKEAIVTSMNLLRSSWSGSLELGISLRGSAHRQLASYLNEHLNAFFADEDSESTKSIPVPTKSNAPPSRKKRARSPKPSEKQSGGLGGFLKDLILGPAGYCIRCGDNLPQSDVDAEQVLCETDYRNWRRFENPDYQEKYCTSCGEERKTTFARPQCKDCYYDR